MSPENQKKYMALSNSHKADGYGPLSGVMQTNSFGIKTAVEDPEGVAWGAQKGGSYAVVGELSSRLNHRCVLADLRAQVNVPITFT